MVNFVLIIKLRARNDCSIHGSQPMATEYEVVVEVLSRSRVSFIKQFHAPMIQSRYDFNGFFNVVFRTFSRKERMNRKELGRPFRLFIFPLLHFCLF